MTSQFNENVIKIAGVLGAAPELRFTASGRTVATLIVYTNHNLRNADGSTRQESERHRVVVWGMHAEKVARLLKKLRRWRTQSLTAAQGAEIVRLDQRLRSLRTLIDDLLARAQQLRPYTSMWRRCGNT